jgi:hypothetical protein
MKATIALSSVLFLFVTATAQAQDGLILPAAAAQQVRPPAPPPPPVIIRRKGSMVGYIESALIDTRVRVRFDIANHNEQPDRAEFFYAKCGCFRTLEGTDLEEFDDNDAPGPAPGVVTDLNFRQMHALVEFGTGRVSFFAEVPLRWIEPQSFAAGTGSFEPTSGLADINLGFKAALASKENTVVTAQVKAFLPTGDSREGLGTDHASVEPAVLVFQQINRVAIESQFGMWFPIGGSAGAPITSESKFAGNVLFYGIGPSVEVWGNGIASVRPVVELVGWHLLGGFSTLNNEQSGTNIVNLKIGGRVAFNRTNSIYVGWGTGLTEQKWYDSILRFEYRASF